MTQSTTEDTKVCTACCIDKPLSEFSRYSASAGGGVRGQCRACRRERDRRGKLDARGKGDTADGRWPAVRIPPVPRLPGRAACADEDPQVFFGPGPRDATPADKGLAAKAICGTCPVAVRIACLRWAMDRDEPGVWGGTTRPERARLKPAAAA